MVSSGPVKDVIVTGDKADLSKLPIVFHCEKDGGPYICPGVMVAKDPDTGIRNIGMYRHMYKGPRRLGASLGPTQHAGHIIGKAESRGQELEVAIILGHHPAVGIGSQYTGPLE